MEPSWTKSIPSETICNFFYAFFVLYAVILALSLLTVIGLFNFGKNMGNFGLMIGIQGILTSLIAGTMMLFYYLLCDRALLAGKQKGGAGMMA
jgi:hypothetical protein